MSKIISILFISLLFITKISAKEPLIIGSKKFSESIILGEIVAILLEEKFNHPTIRKLGLGGTQVALNALKNEDIHVYPDYTGTGYVMILKMDGERDPKIIHQIVGQEFKNRWGIIWSEPIGFNNTYALAVRKDDKRFKNFKNISSLSKNVDSFRYVAPHEFMERKDGHFRFAQTYALNFKEKNIISMEAGLMYSAIKNKQTDMIIAYSTDGRIKAYNLRLIEDDQKFFPPYHVALLAKNKTLKQFPELRIIFNLVKGLITEKEMINMNDQVDRLKGDPNEVARNFLISKSLIKGVQQQIKTDHNFFSYAISKRDYLLKLLVEHLLISFGALFFALIVSLPTGILLTRYQSLGKIIFPFINTIQTIPSLALLGFLVPIIGIGLTPALLALFLYSLLPLIRNTYAGILGVEKTYLEASRGIGLTNRQILLKVEIPLAMPIIIAGLRTASVIVIGTATLAALIGAGGFGDPIFRGVATLNSNLILLGAVPSALLAIGVDKLIGISEKFLISDGIKQKI